MAFFDKLGDIAKNIGDKTNDAIETSKLNSKISSEKSAINEIYKKIGEFYYTKWQEGVVLETESQQFCLEIDEHNKLIAEAQAEIEKIKAESEAAKAATAAAAQQPESTETVAQIPVAPTPRFCTNCGAQVPEGIKFCGTCGTKFEG